MKTKSYALTELLKWINSRAWHYIYGNVPKNITKQTNIFNMLYQKQRHNQVNEHGNVKELKLTI